MSKLKKSHNTHSINCHGRSHIMLPALSTAHWLSALYSSQGIAAKTCRCKYYCWVHFHSFCGVAAACITLHGNHETCYVMQVNSHKNIVTRYYTLNGRATYKTLVQDIVRILNKIFSEIVITFNIQFTTFSNRKHLITNRLKYGCFCQAGSLKKYTI